MNTQEQIEKMKNIDNFLLEFIDQEKNLEEQLENLLQFFKDQNIYESKYDLKAILYIITKISNNHHRNNLFFSKIGLILILLKKSITENFTNIEIFKIFKSNKELLLIALNAKIVTFDEIILAQLLNHKYRKSKYIEFLYPFMSLKMGFIKKIDENSNEKQVAGENDDYICQVIRQDNIEEFITFVKKNDYPLKSKIKDSIYETNPFLLKKKSLFGYSITLIEYATFFGSTQIFNYLRKNGVELTPILWIYAMHGNDAEIIHILEENQINPPNNSYEKCIKESIKCHHNDITRYLIDNYLNQNITNIDFENNYNDNIISYCFHYYNFAYFPSEMYNNQYCFYYACQYDYFKIVVYFMKTKEIDINAKIIFNLIVINNKIFFYE